MTNPCMCGHRDPEFKEPLLHQEGCPYSWRSQPLTVQQPVVDRDLFLQLQPEHGDVVLDDSGNLFNFHRQHGWCGLLSNQKSARGMFARGEGHPYLPLTLLIRNNRAVVEADSLERGQL